MAVCLGVAFWGGSGQVSAADALPRFYDIPAQPLDTALEDYSVASRMQVLYDSRLAAGKKSNALRGEFLPEAALRILLTGTGLVGQYTDTRDVVIVDPDQATDTNLNPKASAGTTIVTNISGVLNLKTLRVEDEAKRQGNYRHYAGIVKTDIQNALRTDRRTRNGRYRIGIKLWIGENGAVLRTEIVDSSGDPVRDEVVALVLASVAISRKPPADMPQPVHIVISAWSV